MVKGNWERRAEMSETRRIEAKQRKQRNADRKTFKSQAQDLMSFLNHNAAQIFRGQQLCQSSCGREADVMIHIWTDSPPSSQDGSSLDETWEDERTISKQKNGKHGRRGRAFSVENDDATRSEKENKKSGKKKSHPRSKESSNNTNPEANDLDSTHKPKLCRSHFFLGKCNENSNRKSGSVGKKGSNCPFAHYSKKENTLTDVLLPKALCDGEQDDFLETVKEILSSSEQSYPESILAGDKTPTAEAMDMVYYSSFGINKLFGSDPNDQLSSGSMSHVIVDAMTKQSCNIGSIVYFAIGDHLLYDRYRKGIIVEENDVIGLDRRKSFASKNTTTEESTESVPLSASILEYILTFLNDTAVATMSLVSHSWNREIGKQSGNLWKFLLERRQWPIPTLDPSNEDTLSTLREAFVSHYTAVRDINAVQTGIDCLLSRKSMNEYDGSVRSFESLRNSPQGENHCVDVKIWATNSFLVAYAQDCTVRLFDSVEGRENSGGRLCRELVCHCVDPHRKTKKRNCKLIAMALDTDFIGCLLHVIDDVSEEEGFILTVTSKDNFLIDDGSNDEIVQVIDIRQSVLNFLLSCDEVDHSLLQLHDFLANDGDLEEIEVSVSQSLVECGYGRFMVEVAVAIPSNDANDEDITILFRKLFLFSTSIGAITWMSDSGQHSLHFRDITEGMTLSSIKLDENGRYGYGIVSLLCSSPSIASLSLDSTGNITRSTFIKGTGLLQDQILIDDWSIRRAQKRPVVMLEDEVVVADNLVRGENEMKKSFLSFFPTNEDDSHTGTAMDTIDLVGNLEVCHLISLKGSHIVAICRSFESSNPENVEAVDDVAGHWFGPGATTAVSSYAIIIDVQSRTEIYRTCLIDDIYLQMGNDSSGQSFVEGEFPVYLAIEGDTVAAGIASKGVVLTGADARRSWFSDKRSQTPSKSGKAKKKKTTKRLKKDGFARGQRALLNLS